jgi:hypothetical protein
MRARFLPRLHTGLVRERACPVPRQPPRTYPHSSTFSGGSPTAVRVSSGLLQSIPLRSPSSRSSIYVPLLQEARNPYAGRRLQGQGACFVVGFRSRPRSSRIRSPTGRRRYGIRQVLSLVILPVPLSFCRRSLLLCSRVPGLTYTRSETVAGIVISVYHINKTHITHHGGKHALTLPKLSDFHHESRCAGCRGRERPPHRQRPRCRRTGSRSALANGYR